MPEARRRLDILLVERGLARTRSRAADAIRRGTVTVDGIVAERPAQSVAPDAGLAIDDDAGRYVSRAALKLAHALDHFAIDPSGLVCIDIGASTGGFTELLLERGAAEVHAVDVGHGQLDPRLAADPRVVSHEGLDARALDRTIVPEPAGLITADVSFIGLEKALPAALALAGPGAVLVALVKPQFEVGPDAVGKDGVVRDPTAREAAVANVADFLARTGWTVIGATPSPIPGKAGNIEILLVARRGLTPHPARRPGPVPGSMP